MNNTEIIKAFDEIAEINGYNKIEKNRIEDLLKQDIDLSEAEVTTVNDLYGNDNLQLVCDEKRYFFDIKTKFKAFRIKENYDDLDFKGPKDIRKIMNFLNSVIERINSYDKLTTNETFTNFVEFENLSKNYEKANISDAIVYLSHIKSILIEDYIVAEDLLGMNDINVE